VLSLNFVSASDNPIILPLKVETTNSLTPGVETQPPSIAVIFSFIYFFHIGSSSPFILKLNISTVESSLAINKSES
jgi:hypothetical protein